MLLQQTKKIIKIKLFESTSSNSSRRIVLILIIRSWPFRENNSYCMVDNENPLIKLITFINHINKVVQCGLVDSTVCSAFDEEGKYLKKNGQTFYIYLLYIFFCFVQKTWTSKFFHFQQLKRNMKEKLPYSMDSSWIQ